MDVVEDLPYLPDIMSDVVARVNDVFSTRVDDPFEVFFDYGIYAQVTRSIYSGGNNKFPLVWLVMNFTEDRGRVGFYADINCQIFIAHPTDARYTQAERDALIFKPRLLPIYKQLIHEIQEEVSFSAPDSGVRHTRILRPYWGGGEVNGDDTPNFFENKYIDAIAINNLRLSVKHAEGIC